MIVDYGMGNLGSVLNMFKKIGVDAVISNQSDTISKAKKLVLPGVGAFDQGMHNLNSLGLIGVLENKVCKEKTPILGICLGMQLFAHRSEEGQARGLGWVDADVVRFKFDPNVDNLKTPHMGWNTVRWVKTHYVSKELHHENRFYFVHSYHLKCKNQDNIIGQTSFGYEFNSVIARDHIVGTQFHPEKSHKFGMQLLRNFASLS